MTDYFAIRGINGTSPLAHDRDGTYRNTVCDRHFTPPKCTNLWHSLTQTPEPSGKDDGKNCGKACDCGRLPCGLYLFDQRQWNTSVNGRTLREWMVHNLTVSPMGMLSPYVDGFYIDDFWSAGMHNGAGGANDLDGTEIHDIGLSGQDVADLESSWIATMDVVKQAILDANGFTWQMMVNNGHGSGSALWYRVIKGGGCAAQLRAACQADSLEQTGALNYDLASKAGPNHTMSLIDFYEHLASFMLIRGPMAWVGFSWISCSVPYARPPQLDTDWGAPIGSCTETSKASGVFTRSWSKADVKLDCNRWQGSVRAKHDDVLASKASAGPRMKGDDTESAYSLNGDLTAGLCACDLGWRGADCGVLNLGPTADNTIGSGRISPAATAKTSSWGGGVVKRNGKFHLYVSEMDNHCGLATWNTNSFIRHAESDTIDGVYTPRETVLGSWAHNAMPWVTPEGDISVWHIGNGTLSRPKRTGCSNGTTPAASTMGQRAENPHPISISQIPYSSTPSGPWKMMSITCNTAAGPGPCPIDNPTPVSFQNGTTLLAHRARGGFGILVAPH